MLNYLETATMVQAIVAVHPDQTVEVDEFTTPQSVWFWDMLLVRHEQLRVSAVTSCDPASDLGQVIKTVQLIHPERFVVRWTRDPA